MADLPNDSGLELSDSEGGGYPHSFRDGFVTGILAALVLVLLLSTGRILLRRYGPDKAEGAEVLTSQKTIDKMREVQGLIEHSYLGDVDEEELSAYLFRGVAAGLADDFARYYTEEELNMEQEANRGEYRGIGVTLKETASPQQIQVTTVTKGAPADKAGVQEGDILLRYNETDLADVHLEDVVSLIKSSEDTFQLTVLRGEQELTFDIECGQVETVSVEYECKEPGIGYIRINEFVTATVRQFRDAVDDLTGQGIKNLIIDLRDNPGGLLNSVCEMLDYILPEGLIVYTERKDGKRSEYRSDDENSLDCNLVVLVNGNSASSSEIFAGAVQDYGLGTIVGTPTYGKGVVQNTYFLSDGSGFKMTVEKYYTPAGQDIDGNGITPDVLVEEEVSEDGEETEDAPLEKALEMLGGGKS